MFVIKETAITKCCTDDLICLIDRQIKIKSEELYNSIRFGFDKKANVKVYKKLKVYKEILKRTYNGEKPSVPLRTIHSRIKSLLNSF